MLRTRTITLVCAAVAALTAVLAMAAPANALYVRPYKATLLDASGATNGCEAKVTEFVITPVHQWVESAIRVVCPEAAGVHRISAEWGVWEVMGDGTLREVDRYVLKRREASLDVLSGTHRYEVAVSGCNLPGGAGTHTWLVRARVATKQTVDNSDPNPYFAKVDRMMTVTCP